MAKENQKDKYKVSYKIDLRKLAAKRGQNIKDFSESCGVSAQSMAQYINGSLSETTIYKIAEALDIDPRDMFFPTDEETPLAEDTLFASTDTAEGATEVAQPVQTIADITDGAQVGFFVFGGKRFKIVEI